LSEGAQSWHSSLIVEQTVLTVLVVQVVCVTGAAVGTASGELLPDGSGELSSEELLLQVLQLMVVFYNKMLSMTTRQFSTWFFTFLVSDRASVILRQQV
jgi:hypothetical protein